MIRVGLIGYGYWGPNLARNIAETDGLELAAVCDFRSDRLDVARQRHCMSMLTHNAEDVIEDLSIDSVVIATPVASHHALAQAALLNGKHVLVEKPLAASYVDALELRDIAEACGLVLMVDHTFVYHPALEEISQRLPRLGKLLYIDSTRVNLGLFQPDVDVVWDLATHDLSILHHLIGRPNGVRAICGDPLGHGKATNAYLHLDYDGGLTAAVNVSWLSPVKVRKMTFGGTRQMLVYDDIEPTEKVKLFNRGAHIDEETRKVDYRLGAILSPKVGFEEALAREMRAFAAAIGGGDVAVADGSAGAEVVRVLEACSKSLLLEGDRIVL